MTFLSLLFGPHMVYRLTIQPYFRWYDLWVGIYIDRRNHIIYWGILPMFGVRFYIAGVELVERRGTERTNTKGDLF